MRTLTTHEMQRFAEQAREAMLGMTGEARGPAGDDAELDAFVAAARPIPHAPESPATAAIAGVDGGGAWPVLEHDGRMLHAAVVACARFAATAGRRGLRATGVDLETRVHAAGANERAGAHATALWLRACAEWERAAREAARAGGADVVLIDGAFDPPALPPALRADVADARARAARAADAHGRAIVAVSKRAGLPRVIELERRIARLGTRDHWRVRIPCAAGAAFLAKFHGAVLRVEVTAACFERRLARGDAAAEGAFFALLDHTAHSVASPGYPHPLRAAHDACTVDARARASIACVLAPEARRLGIPRDALVDAGRRSGHAARGRFSASRGVVPVRHWMP